MKYLPCLILALLFLNACNSTRYITIDIREPASITFEPEIKKIIVVDNGASSSDSDDSDTTEGQSIISPDSVKSILLKHLVQFMNEEKFFDSVALYPKKMNVSGDPNRERPLSRYRIRSICKETDADALLSLDLFAVQAQIESENIGYFNNYRLLSALLGSIMRVYTSDAKKYNPTIAHLDSLFREEHSDWNMTSRNVPLINDLVTELAVIGADKLTGRFIPSWKSQERIYYTNGSSEMKKAEELLKAGKWQEAAEIWSTLSEKEGNKKEKARLASNIALANECLDNIENANRWIDLGVEMLKENDKSTLAREIVKYKAILVSRSTKLSKLYEQLGLTPVEDISIDYDDPAEDDELQIDIDEYNRR